MPEHAVGGGIKRAYVIKDFDSIILSHGGAMDHFDCQLLMIHSDILFCNMQFKFAYISTSISFYS